MLNKKLTAKKKEEWLEEQPDMIVAYKAVKIRLDPKKLKKDKHKKSLYPLYKCRMSPMKRRNHIRPDRNPRTRRKAWTRCDEPMAKGKWHTYMAYFHLFSKEELKGIRNMYRGKENVKIIKCMIPKKFVTDVGYQWGKEIIVTRRFDVVAQDIYIDEPKGLT